MTEEIDRRPPYSAFKLDDALRSRFLNVLLTTDSIRLDPFTLQFARDNKRRHKFSVLQRDTIDNRLLPKYWYDLPDDWQES